MGTAMAKLSSGNEGKKGEEIRPILERCYDQHFKSPDKETWNLAKFYRAVCETVEEINEKFGYTNFSVPEFDKLQKAYAKHHRVEGNPLTKEEFNLIFQELIMETRFSIIGIKDSLYVFGVPLTALVVKQGILPRAIPNEFFIPFVTSATVLIMTKLNKL